MSTNHSRRAALAAPLAVAAAAVAAVPVGAQTSATSRTTARKNLRFIAPAKMADAPTYSHIVEVRCRRSHHAILSEVKKTYVSKTAPPASTTLQVSLLTREGALVEMDVVAALPPA